MFLSRTLNVCHCVPVFSELTQTFIYELLQNLVSCQLNPHVLTWQRQNVESRPFEPVHEITPPTNREIWRIRCARMLPLGIEKNIFPLTSFERRVSKALINANIHVAHIHMGPTAVMLANACRNAGVPFIVTFRGRDASSVKLNKKHWRILYKKTLSKASAITYVSLDIGKRLAPVLPRNIKNRVVRVGKNFENLSYRAPDPPLEELITIGRLIEKKGHLNAIKILSKVRQAGINAKLTIIGDGPLRTRLEREVVLQNLEPYVFFMGAQTYEKTISMLESSDILLAPYCISSNGDSEGIPNTIKEAQAVGVPVVTTNHAGIPEAIPPEQRKYLVEENDVDGLAMRVVKLNQMNEVQLQELTRCAREYVTHVFDPQQEVQSYSNLYQELFFK